MKQLVLELLKALQPFAKQAEGIPPNWPDDGRLRYDHAEHRFIVDAAHDPWAGPLTVAQWRAVSKAYDQGCVEVDPVYCPKCESCGEPGCCSPDVCDAVEGLYCEYNKKAYREMAEEWAALNSELARLVCMLEGTAINLDNANHLLKGWREYQKFVEEQNPGAVTTTTQ